MTRMQRIKAIGMNKQGVTVGKREIHFEIILRASLIIKLIKFLPEFKILLLIPQIQHCHIIRPLSGSGCNWLYACYRL